MKGKVILSYFLIFVLFSLVFFLLFRTPLFASQTVLFYRGNILLALTFVMLFLISGLQRRILKVRFETILAAIIMSASIHLSLFVVFPVTFDRSVTMYLLNRLNSSQSPTCQGLSPQQMQQLFVKEYVKRDQAMTRRIKEQSIINILKEQDNCVSLTPRGRSFLNLSELIKKLYNLN